MSTTTENLGLTLPTEAENYDVEVFNTNAELIDDAVGALQRELGGTGGGLGEKVDTLLENVAAVKTDTAALVQALATANANIATLLTQTKGVKAIYYNSHNFTEREWITAIPNTMNPDRVIILASSGMSNSAADTNGVSWTRSGTTVTFRSWAGHSMAYQFIEFY